MVYLVFFPLQCPSTKNPLARRSQYQQQPRASKVEGSVSLSVTTTRLPGFHYIHTEIVNPVPVQLNADHNYRTNCTILASIVCSSFFKVPRNNLQIIPQTENFPNQIPRHHHRTHTLRCSDKVDMTRSNFNNFLFIKFSLINFPTWKKF